MYKDDTMITNGCSETLLRMLTEGNTSNHPLCELSNSPKNDCNCNKNSWGLEGYPLASVFAPLQSFDNLYDAETALKQGTVFAELDLPFSGRTRQKGGNCRG